MLNKDLVIKTIEKLSLDENGAKVRPVYRQDIKQETNLSDDEINKALEQLRFEDEITENGDKIFIVLDKKSLDGSYWN